MATEQTVYDAERVRDISEAVYRHRLIQSGGKDEPVRMITKDGDNGEKLRGRAGSYDALTRTYLAVLDERGELRNGD